MAGAALRGMGKVLAKHLRKAPVLGKYTRGTPTKAGLVARRAALRGETTAPKEVKAPKKPGFKTGVALGAASALAAKSIDDIMKKAKAEDKAEDKKLKKEIEKHKKKTKEKRKKYGKHHG